MPDPVEEERRRQERTEAARKLFLQLREGGGDLSEEESDHYDFLVNTLSSASNAAEGWVLGDLEGDFLNRSSFVGRRGGEESFRKAFSKLLEGLAGGIAPDTKLQILQLTEDAFRRGVQEMQGIETVMLGAPLDGEDKDGYWDDREMPSSNLLSDAWAARNRASQKLYWSLLDSLSSILTEEQFETLVSNLDVLGFES